MFKLLFRLISLALIIIILIAVLAIWKGGEPFRWIGEKTGKIGKSIERFGDMVDEIKESKKIAEETLRRL